jgi:hypothetical protein
MFQKKKKNQDKCVRLPLSLSEKHNGTEPTSIHEMSWRILRIMSEFVEGFQLLSETSKEVTFW